MKISPHHAVYIGDFTGKHVKPPGSDAAIHAIYTVGRELHGDNFQLWDAEDRKEIYERWHRMPEPVESGTHHCLGCGCPIATKERCKACQHEFRQNNYRVPDKTIHCMDCGVEVPYTLRKPKRCPEHTEAHERKLDTESKARRRAVLVGVSG